MCSSIFLKNTTKLNITCEICINIDGFSLSKSSGSQLYPILITLVTVENPDVLLVDTLDMKNQVIPIPSMV